MGCPDYDVMKAVFAASGGTRSSKRIRIWALRAWTILGLILLVSLYGFAHFFASPRSYNDATLLGGPAGLTIFAIVVALSAYLRAVAGAADEKREKILDGDVKLFPILKPGAQKDGRFACTEEKLKALDNSVENLQVAAYFLIGLSIAVATRLFLEGIARLSSAWLEHLQLPFRLWDVLILEWLVLALIALAVMHWWARRRDEKIRTHAEDCRNACESQRKRSAHPPRSMRQRLLLLARILLR